MDAPIVATVRHMVDSRMFPDTPKQACQLSAPVVLDDHRRLPWRFFGRFTTSIII
jgi:hypothetical protein